MFLELRLYFWYDLFQTTENLILKSENLIFILFFKLIEQINMCLSILLIVLKFFDDFLLLNNGCRIYLSSFLQSLAEVLQKSVTNK